MKVKKSEKVIFNVIWESNVDGEILYEVYPCDTIEVARTKMTEFKNEVLINGHFLNISTDDCTIETDEDRYFIMDNTDDYWEDILIKKSNLFVEDK